MEYGGRHQWCEPILIVDYLLWPAHNYNEHIETVLLSLTLVNTYVQVYGGFIMDIIPW